MVILYTSNTGFTAQYAQMLGKETGMAVYSLDEGKKALSKGTEVIYLGWLMAGHISGLDHASRQFTVRAACGVGMSIPSRQVLETLKKSNFVANAPLFYLPGGYAPDKLKGLKRVMLNLVLKGMRQQLASKPNRTEEDFQQLQLATQGGSLVKKDHLASLLRWISEETSSVL